MHTTHTQTQTQTHTHTSHRHRKRERKRERERGVDGIFIEMTLVRFHSLYYSHFQGSLSIQKGMKFSLKTYNLTVDVPGLADSLAHPITTGVRTDSKGLLFALKKATGICLFQVASSKGKNHFGRAGGPAQ